MKDLKKIIATTIREFLNENSTQKYSGHQQESIPYIDRVYYHGISGRRLELYKKNWEIPKAQQAFGGVFSITDDYDIARGHSMDGIVLVIKVNQNTSFESADPFDDDYFPFGDITDIGESEFIVNNPEKIEVVSEI
jgi:hypothetical protein